MECPRLWTSGVSLQSDLDLTMTRPLPGGSSASAPSLITPILKTARKYGRVKSLSLTNWRALCERGTGRIRSVQFAPGIRGGARAAPTASRCNPSSTTGPTRPSPSLNERVRSILLRHDGALNTMKRKVVTIEEYGDSTDNRSKWSRLFDAIVGEKAAVDFYPLCDKRHFFASGTVYKSVAFSNGILYGGCFNTSCPKRSVLINEFVPTDQEYKNHFLYAIEAHNAAVCAKDLCVAYENRSIIEDLRCDLCMHCRTPRHQRQAVAQEERNPHTRHTPVTHPSHTLPLTPTPNLLLGLSADALVLGQAKVVCVV